MLGNGELLSAADIDANAFVDGLAKDAAREDRVPSWQRKVVVDAGERLTAIARWIGQSTVLASEFPSPILDIDGGRLRKLRDTEGVTRNCQKRKQEPVKETPRKRKLGDLSGCERWDALRRRITLKGSAS